MAELSAIADSIEAEFGLRLEIVSGGNSATCHGQSAAQTLDESMISAWVNQFCSVASHFIANQLTGYTRTPSRLSRK